MIFDSVVDFAPDGGGNSDNHFIAFNCPPVLAGDGDSIALHAHIGDGKTKDQPIAPNRLGELERQLLVAAFAAVDL